MRRVTPFLAGLIFGLGLCLSGMVEPAKVLGFLDLAGAWDPSLAFVLIGAVVVAFVGFQFAGRRGRTLSDAPLRIPAQGAIDARLIAGSLLFGIGWGLAGLCPGPAIVNLGFLEPHAALFVLAMIAGMGLYSAFPTLAAAAKDPAAENG